jgi:hypothetical protein
MEIWMQRLIWLDRWERALPRPAGRPSAERKGERRVYALTGAFVALGLIVRLVRYGVVYPIWHDEAFLAVNFLDRGYLDLMRPLDYSQVSPILFLWIELTAVRILGFSEWSLRLFPALCGLASVLLFRHVAAKLLRGLALPLAVGIFATAFYPIRHSAEVKPYASDLLSALILLAMAIGCWRRPDQSRCWWLLAAASPVLLALSYPAVFVAAGVSLALGPLALRQRRSVRIAFLVCNVVLVASFVSLFLVCTAAQSNALRAYYRWGYWRAAFPPSDRPWELPGWLLSVHTGSTMAYPIGGERGASTVTLIAFVVGIVVFLRSRRLIPVGLMLAPMGMGMAAAALGQYPYGGAPRITQYMAPSICLLAGLGAAEIFSRVCARPWRRRLPVMALGILAAIGCGLIARDFVQPFRVPADERSRRFAREFWSADQRDALTVCARTDLGLVFQPKLWTSGMSAVYLFHRGKYAHPQPRPRILDPHWANQDGRTVRLVLFDEIPHDNPLFERWLARLQGSYRIRSTDAFVVSPGKPGEVWLRERYMVLSLEPEKERIALSEQPLTDLQITR